MNVIVVMSRNRAIGHGGRLLFHLPEDMAFFREKTLGKVVVMGRETCLSLPGKKPLKDRINIVLTTNADLIPDGFLTCSSIEALTEILSEYQSEDVFVVGGESVYRQLLPFCETAYVTLVDADADGDRFFPDIASMEGWKLSDSSEPHRSGDLEYSFLIYKNNGIR